jgi:DNA replication and repair protein RecF
VVSLAELSLLDFRLFAELTFVPPVEGTTVIVGPNGSGKTTILEAVGYLGTQRSFRHAPREAMIRTGAERGIVRGEFRDPNRVLVEAELARIGNSRAQVNRQAARRQELAAAAPVTVFSPDDLALVQRGPSGRREMLDDALRVMDRAAGVTIDEAERVIRQRTALLRQSGGRLKDDIATTLDVWDQRLASAGLALALAREVLVDRAAPLVERGYRALAGRDETVSLAYRRSWEGDLGDALAARRAGDVRAGVTTVGPHRDDLVVRIAGRDARLHASQGEQRSVALALRLGLHQLLTDRLGQPPILLLDDVFSELDPDRSRALVEQLPVSQALVTTAVPLPSRVEVAQVIDVLTVGRRSEAGPRGPDGD